MFESGFQNLSFLVDCISGYTRQPVCPDCNRPEVRLLDRKFIFARLFECQTCLLRFRHPVEDPVRMRSFYQLAYTQEDGITTQLPTKPAWDAMVRGGFGEKDVSHYVSLLHSIFPGRAPSDIRMLDYGCSWGYQTWQFREAGFDCTGFEISTPRAIYGRETLGLPVHTDLQEIRSGFDIFFSSHVIEHVPSPRKFMEQAFDLLNPGGYMIIESPNGSDEFRKQRPEHFHKLWGRVHPFMLSPSFYMHWLAARPAFFTSWPFGDLAERYVGWNQSQRQIDRLDGPSLLMITRKN
jgi:SAM-dependent methyltransferase